MPQSFQSFYCGSVIVVLSLPNFSFMFSGHQSRINNCVCHCTLGLPVSPLWCWLWGECGFWTHLSVWSPNTFCSTFTLCKKKEKEPTQIRSMWPWFCLQIFLPRLRRACYSATNTWWHCGIIALEGEHWTGEQGSLIITHLLIYSLLLFVCSPQVTVKGQNVVM